MSGSAFCCKAAQHLAKLHAEGLVAYDDRAGEIGRPKRFWRLTAKGHSRFPDTHADLTVNLIGGIRLVFGEAGLDRLIEARQQATVDAYRRALEPCSGLEDRVRTVARLRSEEGYMAEFEAESDDSFLLIENHCPICAAAKQIEAMSREERRAQLAELTKRAVQSLGWRVAIEGEAVEEG
jgi:predicted ArsR family transcriptional regulator